jgi:hypothetical protein
VEYFTALLLAWNHRKPKTALQKLHWQKSHNKNVKYMHEKQQQSYYICQSGKETPRMKDTSKDILQQINVRTKKAQRPHPKDITSPRKSKPCPQNQIQIGPCNGITLSVPSMFEQSKFSILQPCTNDILCGRGKSFFNHEGNKRFRDILSKYVNDYRNASHRTKRSDVVKAVVYETLETGARFLNRQERKSEWYDGGETLAKNKVRALNLFYVTYFPVHFYPN